MLASCIQKLHILSTAALLRFRVTPSFRLEPRDISNEGCNEHQNCASKFLIKGKGNAAWTCHTSNAHISTWVKVYWDYIVGFYRDNGKENGNYYSILGLYNRVIGSNWPPCSSKLCG